MYTVTNLVLAFIAGGFYTICGGVFYLNIMDRASISRRWYRMPVWLRVPLLVAWPVPAFWIFL